MDFRTTRKKNDLVAILLIAFNAIAIVSSLIAAVVAVVFASRLGNGLWSCIGALAVMLLFTTVGLFLSVFRYIRPRRYPMTLLVADNRLQMQHGEEIVGEIPFANIRKLEVLRGPDPSTMGGMAGYWEQKRFAEGIGLSIKVIDGDDAKTFWPDEMWKSSREVQIDTEWEMNYQLIFNTINPLVPVEAAKPHPMESFGQSSAPPTQPQPPKAQPPQESNPFDFG